MNLMPMGDYYVWHCDWCDSTNQTIWTRFENVIHCSACQRQISLISSSLFHTQKQELRTIDNTI